MRLALLGTVSALTTDDDGRPLHLGRKQRLASPDQWIALTVRDRGCVAPGCTALPPGARPTTSNGALHRFPWVGLGVIWGSAPLAS